MATYFPPLPYWRRCASDWDSANLLLHSKQVQRIKDVGQQPSRNLNSVTILLVDRYNRCRTNIATLGSGTTEGTWRKERKVLEPTRLRENVRSVGLPRQKILHVRKRSQSFRFFDLRINPLRWIRVPDPSKVIPKTVGSGESSGQAASHISVWKFQEGN